MQDIVNLKGFFEAKSITIIGASSSPGKAGYEIIRNLLTNNYRGKIYPVNPKGGEILGLNVIPKIEMLPAGIDLAVVMLPANKIVETIEQLAEKRIRNAVIAAGGFSEIGSEGECLEEELIRTMGKAGINILGPNTSGLISTPNSIIVSFYYLGKVRQGGVAYVGQTGNFATHSLELILSSEIFGISRVIGLGNKLIIDEVDALHYLSQDPHTSAILVYLEDFSRPRELMEITKELTKSKPIVMLKGGRTEAGVEAAMAHTASLATEDLIIDGFLKQSGIVQISSYSDLIYAGKTLSMAPLPRGNRIAIIAPSGAMLVNLADLAAKKGMIVSNLEAASAIKLQDMSAGFVRMRNPIDIWALVSKMGIEQGYREGLEVALADPNVDSVAMVMMLTENMIKPTTKFIPEIASRYPHKPVLVSFTGDWNLAHLFKQKLEQAGIPTYNEIEKTIEMISLLCECGHVKQTIHRASLTS